MVNVHVTGSNSADEKPGLGSEREQTYRVR